MKKIHELQIYGATQESEKLRNLHDFNCVNYNACFI